MVDSRLSLRESSVRLFRRTSVPGLQVCLPPGGRLKSSYTGESSYYLQYELWATDDWIFDSRKPEAGWVQHFYERPARASQRQGVKLSVVKIMERNQFRPTADDIEELRELWGDHALVDAYERWVGRGDELDQVLRQLEHAFAGQMLGDGIGLLEANGMDDYAGVQELAELRRQDERLDWQRISAETLNRHFWSVAFFDARGYVFHLPAFLIAELNGQYHYGFLDDLIVRIGGSPDWLSLLTSAQRDALAATFGLIKDHPEYVERSEEIEGVIETLRAQP